MALSLLLASAVATAPAALAPAASSSGGTGTCFLRASIDLRACRRFHGIDTWTHANGTWTRHASFNCFQGHGAACVGSCNSLGSNYTLEACEAACLQNPKCTGVCVPPPAPAPPKPELNYTDVFGSATQICTGAQMVATKKSLLVWGECQKTPEPKNPSDPKNLVIQLRRSTDWGGTWGPVLPQPFPPPYLSQVIYDPQQDVVVSVGPCPGSHPPPSDSLSVSSGCGAPFPCWSRSTDEGTHWSPFTPAGAGNGTYGGAEGSLGTAALSNGNLLSPFSVKNCSDPKASQVNRVLISADHGKTWQVGGPTPSIVDGKQKPWGESAVAELANGSVVMTSRLSQPIAAASRWRGFAISHDGGKSWEPNAWTFPADQPFDTGFGPGYNCEAGLLSVRNRTKLLLSHPTATLKGDSTGAPHSRCSPGSCTYRRNLTIAASDDGGVSWSIEPWGLVYSNRLAYSAMAELPSGKVAVVFERGPPDGQAPGGEYRYLSVAVVTPSWVSVSSEEEEGANDSNE